MKKLAIIMVCLALFGLGIFWVVTIPKTGDPGELAGLVPDLEQGAAVFTIGGCASCHAAENAKGDAKLILAGGRAFASDFGTFYAPNISPDPDVGIGNWTPIDLLNAMRYGTSPGGKHYFPAFPYSAYAHATTQDIVSLFAYLKTLPASATENRAHEVGFPFNIRRSLGGWKLLFQPKGWALKDAATPEIERGRYLVEALGHCGECHTPRNALGGLQISRWLGGAPNPSGKGNIPNITTAKLDWIDSDVLAYFTTGFTPDFDTVGGHMVDVVENLSAMPEAELIAIIAYLRAVPAVE